MITSKRIYARLFWSLLPERAVPFADPCADPHDTVAVDGIALDVSIAPLVVYLWRHGIATHSSCQGDAVLYRLHASRHPAEGTPTGNPYAAYLTLGGLDSARAVVEILDPPAENMVALSTDGLSDGQWWFACFHPALLHQWLASRPTAGCP